MPTSVVVFDLCEHDGNPCIVMEYLDGEQLDCTIRRYAALTVLQKIDIIVQVSKALQYAHERGIFHRDVKPGNIMLTRDGSVKVVDFGIAHLADHTITRTGLVLGTVSYMSPEQLNGEPVDARSDIFSLGWEA
jgi:serine/threonine protein kinase